MPPEDEDENTSEFWSPPCSAECPSSNVLYEDGWHHLRRGDPIRLKFNQNVELDAIVEDYLADFSAVWVRLHNLNERRLLIPSDGIQIIPSKGTTA
jgi:hypothetical protein